MVAKLPVSLRQQLTQAVIRWLCLYYRNYNYPSYQHHQLNFVNYEFRTTSSQTTNLSPRTSVNEGNNYNYVGSSSFGTAFGHYCFD